MPVNVEQLSYTPQNPYINPSMAQATNLGQFSGILNNISGLIQAKNVRDMHQREQDAELLSKGLIRDANPNSPSYNQVKRDPNSEQAYQQDLAEKDPDSPQSGMLRQLYKSNLQTTNPELANSITDDMSAYQLRLYEKQFGGLIGKQMGTQISRERLNLQKGNQAANVANVFDKDHVITQLQTQQNQIQRDKHTLETSDVLTPQMFNEIQIGIANAISGGKSAAVATQNKVEFQSLATEAQALKQRLLNKPEDIQSPEVKKYISSILDRLNDAYQNNMAARAEQLAKGRSRAYSNNPAAMDVLNEKAGSYKPAEGLIKQDASGDQEAIDWAKQNPNDPRAAQILKLHGM